MFLEPLLRWLQQGKNEYTFETSKVKISSAAYADDLAAFANKFKTTNLTNSVNGLVWILESPNAQLLDAQTNPK